MSGGIVAWVTDLMDRSKISSAAPGVRFVRSVAELEGVEAGDLVVLDLARPDALDALVALPAGVRTIGFGSHVATDVLDAARAAGCDEVLPRSAFFTRLPGLLAP
ncbi:MAG TPA: hypothetical protein VFA94_03230 [Acidimicrobiales bacterium]|nr:hypothetical protein [Acidimicrobiales bacterium]